MKIFGKTLGEYFAFCKIALLIIVVVGIARFALSIGGVPNSMAKWVSITIVTLIGTIYYAVRVHTTGFGSYKQLLPIVFLMVSIAQVVIIAAILVAIFTGHDNIFSAPEYSGGEDGKTWLHVGAHILLPPTVGTLVTWIIGCIAMFITKKVSPRDPAAAA